MRLYLLIYSVITFFFTAVAHYALALDSCEGIQSGGVRPVNGCDPAWAASQDDPRLTQAREAIAQQFSALAAEPGALPPSLAEARALLAPPHQTPVASD